MMSAVLLRALTLPSLPSLAGLSDQRGLWSIVKDAVTDSRRRSAECEVARFIERNGGVLTDSLEREISRRFGSSA
jgi:hypothetical protein